MNYLNRFRSLFILVIILVLLFSCNNEEIGDSSDVNPESVFFDYSLTGSGETGQAVLKLQYRFGGPNGTTLVLRGPSQVSFDGQLMQVDSSRTEGAFYELIGSPADFAGKHEVVFTATDGKKYAEAIDYAVFGLEQELPDTVSRQGFSIRLTGLPEGSRVQLLATDTVAFSRGVDLFDTLRNGEVSISASDLQALKSGPVNLEIISHHSRPLREVTPEGGRIYFSYNIRKELFIQ